MSFCVFVQGLLRFEVESQHSPQARKFLTLKTHSRTQQVSLNCANCVAVANCVVAADLRNQFIRRQSMRACSSNADPDLHNAAFHLIMFDHLLI